MTLNAVDFGTTEFDDATTDAETAIDNNYSSSSDLSSSLNSDFSSYMGTSNALANAIVDDGSSFDATASAFYGLHDTLDTAADTTDALMGVGAGAVQSIALHIDPAVVGEEGSLLTTALTNAGFSSTDAATYAGQLNEIGEGIEQAETAAMFAATVGLVTVDYLAGDLGQATEDVAVAMGAGLAATATKAAFSLDGPVVTNLILGFLDGPAPEAALAIAGVIAEPLVVGALAVGAALVAGEVIKDHWSDITTFVEDGGTVGGTGWSSLVSSLGSTASDLYSDTSSISSEVAQAVGGLYGSVPQDARALPDPIAAALAQFGTAEVQSSPLVIDLSSGHTGIQLTTFDAATTTTFFDIEGTGFATQTAWTSGSTTGFLVDDLNSNGKIDSVSEMFGSSTVDGFAQLAALDSNHDLKIDSNDAAWSSLQVWIDANGNGVTDAGELHSLSSLGITSIDLAGVAPSTSTLDGNSISHTSTVTFTDGDTAAIDDVWFTHSTTNTSYNGDYTLDPDTLFLPDLRGYGTLPDLDIAMSQDSTLKGMVSDFVTEFATDGFASSTLDTDAANILYQWAGVEGVDPTSRGLYVSAQDLGFLEHLFGQTFDQNGNPNPLAIAGESVESAFNTVFDAFRADLLIQAGADSLFTSPVTYNPWTGAITGDVHLSETAIADLATHAPGTEGAAESFWVSVANFVDATEGISNLTTDEQTWLNTAVSSSTTTDWDGIVTLYDAASSVLPIDGTSGNDTLTGGSGENTINGNGGNDIFHPGAGGNILNGGGGNDAYYFEHGNDLITDSGGTDQIIMPSGVALGDLTFTRVESSGGGFNDLLITVARGGTIQINEQFAGGAHPVESVQFSDLTTVNLTTLTGYQTILSSGDDSYIPNINIDQTVYGMDGNDYIGTGSGNDILDGGNGNDQLSGATGNDTYIASPGSDTIYDTGGTDTINVPTGYSASDVTFSRESSSANNLVITINGLGEIDIQQQFVSSSYAIENLHFLEDGTTISLTDQIIQTIGTAGDDYLVGLTSNVSGNWFDGRGGSDTFVAGHGSNTFVIEAGFGNDTVEGLSKTSTNIIDFTGVAPSNVQMWTDSSGELHLQDSTNPSHSITIAAGTTGSGQYETAIGQYMSEIVFDDPSHTTWNLNADLNISHDNSGDNLYGSAYGDTITGGTGNDTIYGNGGGDTIISGGGSDNLNGGGGNDTFVFAAGFGNSIVSDNASAGSSTIYLSGIDPADVRLWTDSSGYLHLQDTTDPAYNITVYAGTTGSGTHESTIGEYFSQVTFDGSYNTTWDLTGGLHITADNSNNQLYGTAYADLITGGTGSDTIYGNGGDDIIISGGGSDNLNGGDGNDTYVFTAGFGNSNVSDNASAGANTIHFTGVDPADIRMWTDTSGYLHLEDTTNPSYNITVYAGTTGSGTHESTIGDYFSQVTFDGGYNTTWDLTGGLTLTGTSSAENLFGTAHDDTLNGMGGGDTLYGNGGNDTLNGGSSADNLYGGDGDDILYGAGGNDYLTGGAGADTFLFKADTALTGNATIADFSTSQGDKIDIADVLHSYNPLTDAISDFVQLTTSGSNTILKVDIDGTGTGHAPTAIATIQGVTGLDLDTLIANHQLIISHSS